MFVRAVQFLAVLMKSRFVLVAVAAMMSDAEQKILTTQTTRLNDND